MKLSFKNEVFVILKTLILVIDPGVEWTLGNRDFTKYRTHLRLYYAVISHDFPLSAKYTGPQVTLSSRVSNVWELACCPMVALHSSSPDNAHSYQELQFLGYVHLHTLPESSSWVSHISLYLYVNLLEPWLFDVLKSIFSLFFILIWAESITVLRTL